MYPRRVETRCDLTAITKPNGALSARRSRSRSRLDRECCFLTGCVRVRVSLLLATQRNATPATRTDPKQGCRSLPGHPIAGSEESASLAEKLGTMPVVRVVKRVRSRSYPRTACIWSYLLSFSRPVPVRSLPCVSLSFAPLLACRATRVTSRLFLHRLPASNLADLLPSHQSWVS